MDRDRNHSPLLGGQEAEYNEKHAHSRNNANYGLPRHLMRLSARKLIILVLLVVVTPTLMIFNHFQNSRAPIDSTENVKPIVYDQGKASSLHGATKAVNHKHAKSTTIEESSQSTAVVEVAESTYAEDEVEATSYTHDNAPSEATNAPQKEKEEGENVPDDGGPPPPPPPPPPEPPIEPPVQPADEPVVDAPAEVPSDAPGEPPAEPPVDPPVDSAVEPPADAPDAPPPPPIDPPAEPPVDHPVEPPVEPPAEPPVEPPAEPPVEPPAEPPVDPLVDPALPPPPPPPPVNPDGSENPENQPPPPPNDIGRPHPGDHRMVILIPMDSPTPELCKVLFSAMANGYPSPIIINWGNDRDRVNGGLDRSHLYKIIKGVEYLDAMMHQTAHEADRIYEDDLVVVVDGLDVWWQLPPAVFIQRYHDMNRRAQERLREAWGPGRMPMKQTIVAGAQKKCWPDGLFGNNLHCDKLPDSPQRPDLYGPLTDKEDEELRFMRPKYYNAGTLVGTAGDLARFYRRALHRMSEIEAFNHELRSDQGLQAEIWSQQELFRTWLTKQPNRAADDFLDEPIIREIRFNFEYHVGIDYAGELFVPTVFKEVDGDFVTLNNQTNIELRSKELEIDPVRLLDLPEDVKAAQNPLARILPENETPGWRDAPLYADFFSEVVPVIVHHNAHKDGLKERRVWWWDRTWFFPHLRRFVQDYLARPTELPVLAEIPAGDSKATYRAVPSELYKRRPRRFEPEMAQVGLPEMDFHELCRAKPDQEAWWDQVFRDGRGPV